MFTADFSQVEAFLLNELPKFVSTDLLPLGGDIARTSIIDNAAKSQNVRGRGFPVLGNPYYKRKLAFKGEGNPDLNLYGDLLPSMMYVPVAENFGVLTVPDDQQKKAEGLTKNGRAFLIGSQGIVNSWVHKGTEALRKFLGSNTR